MGLRVSIQEEIEGLDIGEHGQTTYPEFVTRKPAYSYVSIAERIAE
jgi:Amt family ammonium transporter